MNNHNPFASYTHAAKACFEQFSKWSDQVDFTALGAKLERMSNEEPMEDLSRDEIKVLAWAMATSVNYGISAHEKPVAKPKLNRRFKAVQPKPAFTRGGASMRIM